MWALLLLLAMDVEAVGTIRSARQSVAILRANGTTVVARPGETVLGLTVVGVSAQGVLVERGGTRELLPLRGTPRPPTTTAAGPEPPPIPLDRAELIAHIAREGPHLVEETTIAPWPGGGLVLARLDPDGLLGKLGFAAGDIVLAIDGRPVAGLPDVAALVDRLPRLRAVAVRVQRDGREKVIRFTLE